MAQIEIDPRDRKKADEIVRFVKNFMTDLSVEGRFVLALELMRLMKPELDELKRKADS
jgi:hypothetical protein